MSLLAMTRLALCLLALLCVATVTAAPSHAACVDDTPGELRDGYCTPDGYNVPGLITHATYWLTPPVHTRGRALYQAPGVMEATAELKGYDTSGVEGLVSLLSPATAGWTLHIQAPTRAGWIRVMDVDAAARAHYYAHIVYADSPIELSYALAEQLGNINWTDANGDRYFDVDICLSLQPETDCAGAALSYREWFRSVLRLEGE